MKKIKLDAKMFLSFDNVRTKKDEKETK